LNARAQKAKKIVLNLKQQQHTYVTEQSGEGRVTQASIFGDT